MSGEYTHKFLLLTLTISVLDWPGLCAFVSIGTPAA